jgi:NADPH:quinone reductase-like Zn-dependent oxidoreductase
MLLKAAVYDRYGPPDVIDVKEVETPSPKDDEVLIRIHAAVVTAVDKVARSGTDFAARLAFGLTKPKMRTLGTEFAGEVEAVGKAVTRFKAGDQVFGASGTAFGAHAEYICLPENGALAAKPGGASYEGAAAIAESGLTALPFLRDSGKIKSGDRVLVNGASGSVGTAAVQLAKVFGAEVTGVCGAANAELVRSLGADHVIDYAKEDFTGARNAYDIIFDTVGKSSFGRCKGALKDNGIYLTTVVSPAILLQMPWTGARGGKKAVIAFTGLRSPADKVADLGFLGELVEAGRIRAAIGRRYRLDQIVEAHRYVETGHKAGNCVLVLDVA